MDMLYLAIVSLIHMVLAYTYTSNDGVTISYSIRRPNLCHSETGKFAVMQGISVPECVKECGLRTHCQALQYRRRFFICELFQSTEYGNVRGGDCVFINGSDINVHMNPCGVCLNGGVCNTSLETCRHHECPNKSVLENGQIEGNMNEIDGKIKFTCNDGYRATNGVVGSVCLESGNWSTSVQCRRDFCDNPPIIYNGHVTQMSPTTAAVICDEGYRNTTAVIGCTDPDTWGSVLCAPVVCGSPPSIMHGRIVVDTGNGHSFMDTATVICDDWLQSDITSITCTSTASWENPTDCIDCYSATPCEYIGRTNVTKSGKMCQRWDSDDPHSHPHTDLQYYPEASISEAGNYCRNPEQEEHDPWCFTMDPDKKWEYCNVKKCPWT